MTRLLAVPAEPGPYRLALCLAVLAASVAAFSWFGIAGADRATAASTAAIADQVRLDAAQTRRRTRALTASPAPEAAPDPTVFLRDLHEAASRSGLEVSRLAPHAGDGKILDLGLSGTFPAFLRFAAEAELLGAGLDEFQAAPRGTGQDGNQLDITVAVRTPGRGAVAGRHADAVRAAALDARLRDPFLRAADAGSLRADLSAKHHLTGVTLAGSARYATVDGMDYGAGDTLDGLLVTAVTADAVLLSRGEERFTVRFPDGR